MATLSANTAFELCIDNTYFGGDKYVVPLFQWLKAKGTNTTKNMLITEKVIVDGLAGFREGEW